MSFPQPDLNLCHSTNTIPALGGHCIHISSGIVWNIENKLYHITLKQGKYFTVHTLRSVRTKSSPNVFDWGALPPVLEKKRPNF